MQMKCILHRYYNIYLFRTCLQSSRIYTWQHNVSIHWKSKEWMLWSQCERCTKAVTRIRSSVYSDNKMLTSETYVTSNITQRYCKRPATKWTLMLSNMELIGAKYDVTETWPSFEFLAWAPKRTSLVIWTIIYVSGSDNCFKFTKCLKARFSGGRCKYAALF